MSSQDWTDEIEENPQIYSGLSTPQFSLRGSENIPFKLHLQDHPPNDRYSKYLNNQNSQNLNNPENFGHGTKTREQIEQLRSQTAAKLEELRKIYMENEQTLSEYIENEDEKKVIKVTRPKIFKSGSKAVKSPEFKYRTSELDSRYLSPIESNDFEGGSQEEINRLKAELEYLQQNSVDFSPGNFKNSLTTTLSIECQNQQKAEEGAQAVQEAYEKALADKEKELRDQYLQDFEQEKAEIRQKYEKEMHEVIAEMKINLEKYWKKKYQEQANRMEYQQIQAQEQQQKQQYDELVAKERQKIYNEVEAELQKELQERISQSEQSHQRKMRQADLVRQPSQQEINKFREQQEIDLELRICSEKESWKRELTSMVIEEFRLQVKREAEEMLQLKRNELDKRADNEINELLNKIRNESQTALEAQLKQIEDEMKQEMLQAEDKIRQECIEELQNDPDFLVQQGLISSLKQEIENKLRVELRPSIERELKTTVEENIKQGIAEEARQELEAKRLKLEQETRSKIREIEEEFELKHNEEVNNKVQQQLQKVERDIKIQYMRKLDNQKKAIADQISSQKDKSIKKEKQELNKLKSEVARLRSALNVQVKNLQKERQNHIKTIQDTEFQLQRKLRSNESLRRAQESYMFEKEPQQTEYQSYSPQKHSVLTPEQFDFNQDFVDSLPQTLPPPTQEQDSEDEPQRKLLSQYDSQNLVSTLIQKNLEEAKKHARQLLGDGESIKTTYVNYYNRVPEDEPIQQTVKTPLYYRSPEIAQPRRKIENKKTSKYEELLKQRYGVIEPRLR